MFLLLFFVLSSIAYAAELNVTEARYDFDHKVHYRLTRLSDKSYRLSVRSGNYQAFNKQVVFLLRQSARLCRSEQFNLLFESGVQPFERFPTEPRAYPGPLVAKLICP